ncbi:unnamed protein product [Spirodela intermedia]|uniref:Uncharacterized protein n=1 Tax=Spirodela intermedia TaxID=51605 RepID=A0A7I8IEP1_SPIIN|nr:unnamed protein product [Spirodela intermedia]CAA6656091.1 unnamed protein product [Spirodela intermedia]
MGDEAPRGRPRASAEPPWGHRRPRLLLRPPRPPPPRRNHRPRPLPRLPPRKTPPHRRRAAVYELNATAPAGGAAVVSTRMQFTVAIRNPNQRSSVLYDRLAAYVAFREQPITPAAPLPPMYQEEDSTVAVSPLLGGALVAVAPEVAGGLQTEQAYGALGLRLVLMGRIKYKVGPLYSVWASMFARCDILVSLRRARTVRCPSSA